ncbi:hypothetical protein ACPUVO_06060 [Pseudocolwellia sp. HL-MZ19]|uniref:hypothetical protein n=1 Tax=Pseudocolwellia sp. HL-MZ19 TaxID=3400846 RepID=UPI003CEBE6F9
MFIRLIALMLMVMSFQSYGAKKECAGLLDKFQNIQSQLKQGQSIKSSASLRKKEDIAREKWWDCENNKTTSSSTSKKKKTYKKKVVKLKKTDKSILEDAPQVFSSNKNIVIKGRFSGDKQLQWLEYYQRPKKCGRPKTTQVFAFCMEDKTEQQNKFEQEYQNNK